MSVNLQLSQSYYWLNCWVMADIIQRSVHDFCDQFKMLQSQNKIQLERFPRRETSRNR